MRILATGEVPAGNARGFTLLELLLVVALVAIVSAGVSFSLRDSGQAKLEMQGQQLAAVLDAARAQSRMLGVPVRWRPTDNGYQLEGLPSPNNTAQWKDKGTLARSAQADGSVLLGPEPLIAAQTIRLWNTETPELQIRIRTDGVRPFALSP